MSNPIYNPHAGYMLKTEFLDEIAISQNALAKALHVPANRIHQIVNRQRRITADTDVRLCRFFGLSEGYFWRLQNAHELLEAKRSMKDILLAIPECYKETKYAGKGV